MDRELMDDDGENLAVRCFLGMYQCGGNPSVKSMKIHLEHSGFNGCWPDWVNDPKNAGHLTKGGAQSWLRHLFGLERSAHEADAARIVDLERQLKQCVEQSAVWAAVAGKNCQDAALLNALEGEIVSSGYALQLIQVRDPSKLAGMNRIVISTGVGSGPWARKYDGYTLREAIAALSSAKENSGE